MEKGKVCVIEGTEYLGSWIVMRLLQLGYSVNTTMTPSPDGKKDVSHLTNLPGAQERLRIFNADLDNPEGFDAAIKGCIGVFHAAHPPIDLEKEESEEALTRTTLNTTLAILQACLNNSKTVKRVICTSSAATVMAGGSDTVDESSWTDVDLVRAINPFGASYVISKTLTEKAALEFAERNGIDLVTVIPSNLHGPFITPRVPGSVRSSMEMILGTENNSMYSPAKIDFIHIDDLANAHIFLLEYPNAKGRYICSAVEITKDKLAEFISARYPEFRKEITEKTEVNGGGYKTPTLSSKKLLETGFKYKYGLEEIYDGAIDSCKQRGIL